MSIYLHNSDTAVLLHQSSFRHYLEAHATEKMEEMFRLVPFARDFHEGDWIDEEYYKRHIIEAIIRIKLNNEVDAYCLYKIDQNDRYVFGELAKYLAEEYSHDTLFLSDLSRFGIKQEEVSKTSPFLSTQLLMGYLYLSINKSGVLADIIWNWFVEWYSNRYNQAITKKAGEKFGIDKVEGCLAHLRIDKNEEHGSLMFSLIEKTVKGQDDRDRIKEYLTNFVKLIGMYFQELYEATIGTSAKPQNIDKQDY